MWKLLLLCFGATCLYVGGMYLNDAFDVEFDRQHRHERPIPSGAIHLEEVWRWSFGWMVVGLTSLLCLGSSVVILTLLLAGAIVLYDAIHKIIAFSPLLMAACRFLLVLLAAAAGVEGITGLALWSAFALGAYIVGLSYIAQFESVRGALRYWPLIFLAAPVVLAHFVDAGEYRFRGTVLSLLLAAWVVWCLRHMFWRGQRNLGHTVSGLLAGIVLVDWLALCSSSPALSARSQWVCRRFSRLRRFPVTVS